MKPVPNPTTLPEGSQLINLLRSFAASINQAAEGRLREFVRMTTGGSTKPNDLVILVAPGAPLTVSIPAAREMEFKTVTVKRTNTTTHTITVTPVSGQIDNATSATLTTSLQVRSFYSDGSNYWIV